MKSTDEAARNDSAFRAMLEELDAELELRMLDSPLALMATGSGMHWMAERAARHGVHVDLVVGMA